MTPYEVAIRLSELAACKVRGEITEAEALKASGELLKKARLEMSEAQFGEIQRHLLAVQQLVADTIFSVGADVPGNNPRKPN